MATATKKTVKKKTVRRTDKLSFLRDISILKGLSTEQLKLFGDICTKITAKPGDAIMREGERGDTMYLFVDGEVEFTNKATMKIPKKGFEEAETIGGKLNASFVPFFGDMSLFDDAPRSATIRAISDCVLYEVHRDEFDRICEEDKQMGYIILKNIIPVMSNRIRMGNDNVLKLTTLLTIVLSKKR